MTSKLPWDSGPNVRKKSQNVVWLIFRGGGDIE